MPKVQVYVSEGLAERVASLAEGDDRTVSQWIRLLLEREVWQEATAPLVEPEPAAPGVLEDDRYPFECDHPKTVKRETTFGVRRFCADPKCGALL